MLHNKAVLVSYWGLCVPSNKLCIISGTSVTRKRVRINVLFGQLKPIHLYTELSWNTLHCAPNTLFAISGFRLQKVLLYSINQLKNQSHLSLKTIRYVGAFRIPKTLPLYYRKPTDWLTDWLTDRQTDWLTDWQTDWLID